MLALIYAKLLNDLNIKQKKIKKYYEAIKEKIIRNLFEEFIIQKQK
jgi:hypothetical protein